MQNNFINECKKKRGINIFAYMRRILQANNMIIKENLILAFRKKNNGN